MASIEQLFEEALGARIFSGYQLLAKRGDFSIELSGGMTSYWPGAKTIDHSSYFDIGSVTKVVVTVSLVGQLLKKRVLSLDAQLPDIFPALKKSFLSKATIGDLLNHSSGLIGWYPVFKEIGSLSYLDWLVKNSEKLKAADVGTKAIYSDLGFLLLGEIIKNYEGDLADAFKKQVAAPLDLQKLTYGPLPDSAIVAATEYCRERKRVLEGEVFDENCWKLGGECAHAGLFSDARSLGKFCDEWLKVTQGKSKWLDAHTGSLLTTKLGKVKGNSFGYGFDTKTPPLSSCGKLFSNQSFGHLGYPGCSIWMDPVAQGYVVLLTNRIHPSRVDERIKRFRPICHDMVAEAWK